MALSQEASSKKDNDTENRLTGAIQSADFFWDLIPAQYHGATAKVCVSLSLLPMNCRRNVFASYWIILQKHLKMLPVLK